MSIIKEMREFIFEQDFKITYIQNKLDVLNYTNISHFDSNKIIINYKDGSIVVAGENLVVSKLLNDELLIEGSIQQIEFR